MEATSVPLYHFTFQEGTGAGDQIAIELADDSSACAEAVRTAGEILRDLSGGLPQPDWRMELSDDAGHSLMTLQIILTDGIGVTLRRFAAEVTPERAFRVH